MHEQNGGKQRRQQRRKTDINRADLKVPYRIKQAVGRDIISDDGPAGSFFVGCCAAAQVSAEKFTDVIQNNAVILCLFLL